MIKAKPMDKVLKICLAVVRIALLDVDAIEDLIGETVAYVGERGLEQSCEEAASSVVSVGSDVVSGDVTILGLCQRNPEILEAMGAVIELKEISDDIREVSQDVLQLYAVFSLMDSDDNKSISFDELWDFLQCYGSAPFRYDKVLIRQCFQALDTDGSGSISFKEFAVGMFARIKVVLPFITNAALTMKDMIERANPNLPKDVFLKNYKSLVLANIKKDTYSYTSKGQYWNKVCDPIRFDAQNKAYCGLSLGNGGECGGGKQCIDCNGCTVARPQRATAMPAAMQKRVGRCFAEHCSHPFYPTGNQYGDIGFGCKKCGVHHKPNRMNERWHCFFCDKDVCLTCEKNDDFTVPVMERCPKGHEMVVAKSHSDAGVSCDMCRKSIQNQVIGGHLSESPSPRWTCLTCEYDCCFQCLPL